MSTKKPDPPAPPTHKKEPTIPKQEQPTPAPTTWADFDEGPARPGPGSWAYWDD